MAGVEEAEGEIKNFTVASGERERREDDGVGGVGVFDDAAGGAEFGGGEFGLVVRKAQYFFELGEQRAGTQGFAVVEDVGAELGEGDAVLIFAQFAVSVKQLETSRGFFGGGANEAAEDFGGFEFVDDGDVVGEQQAEAFGGVGGEAGGGRLGCVGAEGLDERLPVCGGTHVFGQLEIVFSFFGKTTTREDAVEQGEGNRRMSGDTQYDELRQKASGIRVFDDAFQARDELGRGLYFGFDFVGGHVVSRSKVAGMVSLLAVSSMSCGRGVLLQWAG